MSIAKTLGGGSRPRRLLTGKSGGKGVSSQQEVRQSRPQDCPIQLQQFAPDGASHIHLCTAPGTGTEVRHAIPPRSSPGMCLRKRPGTLVRDSVEASCQPWLGQLALLQASHSQLRPWSATARQLHHESPQQALPLPAPRKQHFLMMPHYRLSRVSLHREGTGQLSSTASRHYRLAVFIYLSVASSPRREDGSVTASRRPAQRGLGQSFYGLNGQS